jgi:membrane-associated protease RseP (regulator of RpoE activity)
LAPLPRDPFAPRREDDPASPADETARDDVSRYPEAPIRRPEYDFGPGLPPPFRLDSASVARIPLPAERDLPPLPQAFVPAPYPRDRVALHVGLFLATLLTTTLVGADHWASYISDFGQRRIAVSWWLLAQGLWYSLTILGILGAHEFGHYFACRYYRVNASLPYFIPVPPPLLTGTLGAFIRIRQPIRTKRVLFDIGIAGPLAGFIVALPALVVGIALSHVAALPKNFTGLELGEPLLFRIVTTAIWGHIADGYSLNLHPIAFAAWFGLLATALNLFPIGQLDGGHIAYTVFGRFSSRITMVAIGVAVILTFVSMSWLVWTVMMVVMLYFFGTHHPPTMDEHLPLDRTRLVLAVVALVVFVLSFTPAPIQPLDLLQK